MMKRKNQLLILHILGWMFTKDFPGQDIQNALILALLQQNYFLKHFQMQVTISKWDKNQKQQVRQNFDSRFYHQMGRSPKCQCLCFLFLVVPPMQGDNIVKCEQHKALKTVASTGFLQILFLLPVDPEHPALICVATITQIQGHRLLIHFDGFSKVCIGFFAQQL